MADSPIKDVIKFQLQASTTKLSVDFLNIIEDLQNDGYVIPEDKYQRIRKRVLDSNGQTYRFLQSLIDQIP
jgi:hypothetical protein